MTDSEDELHRALAAQRAAEDALRALMPGLMSAPSPTSYGMSREAAEAVERLPGQLRALRKEVESLRDAVDDVEAIRKDLDRVVIAIDKLEAAVARKREALYGGPDGPGLKPRVEGLEKRVGDPESLSSQAAKVAAFVAAAGGAAAAAVAVAKALG